MNKHNSVTSTYYLLLKHKKREYIHKIESSGKVINKYFEISNEKQELIDLLMSFEPSSKKKNQPKVAQGMKEELKAKKETAKEKLMREFKNENKKVENIEIIPGSRSQDRTSKGGKSNFQTIEPPMVQKPEFKTIDYTNPDNSRNNTTLSNIDQNGIMSLKHKKQKEINYIKNRRTGSTDCTNKHFAKPEIKRIPNFHKRAVIELDTDEGEIIVSNRRNDPEKFSPSPSPQKYDIEPN